MAKINEIIKAVESIAPLYLMEDWDNSGIQVMPDSSKDVELIMTALEISDSVIDEAEKIGADMIVTHHPLIFGKLSRVTDSDVVQRQIIRLIKSGISVYSAHTSFDSAAHGTNQYLAEKIGLESISALIAGADEGTGMGRTGIYEEPITFDEFIKRLTDACDEDTFRIAGKIPKKVKRVSLCTGAGAEFADLLADIGSDVYITGDVKYHDARHADDIGLCLIDAGHFGTENIFAQNIMPQLEKILGDSVKIVASQTSVYPFRDCFRNYYEYVEKL